MLKILVPVNGSECSLKAVDEAIRITRANDNAMVQLVNVQPLISRHIARFLSGKQTDALRIARGEQALQAARRRLDAAGVRYSSRILRGRIVPTVVSYAAESGTNQIVVGTSPAGNRLLRDSISNGLIEHAPVPVDVVRGGHVGIFERFGLPAGLGLGLAVFWLTNQ